MLSWWAVVGAASLSPLFVLASLQGSGKESEVLALIVLLFLSNTSLSK